LWRVAVMPKGVPVWSAPVKQEGHDILVLAWRVRKEYGWEERRELKMGELKRRGSAIVTISAQRRRQGLLSPSPSTQIAGTIIG
jgi:hypothetical protein